MNEAPIVTKLKMTLSACPSQWEGRISDGRHVYIRYRFGGLSVGIGDTFDDAVCNYFFESDIGGPLNGCMDTEAMQGHLDGVLTFET